MIEAYRYTEGVSERERIDPEHLADGRRGPGTLLVVEVVDFNDEELTRLAKSLPIHPLALEDLRTSNQRTKLERYGDHWHVAVHSAMVNGRRPRHQGSRRGVRRGLVPRGTATGRGR